MWFTTHQPQLPPQCRTSRHSSVDKKKINVESSKTDKIGRELKLRLGKGSRRPKLDRGKRLKPDKGRRMRGNSKSKLPKLPRNKKRKPPRRLKLKSKKPSKKPLLLLLPLKTPRLERHLESAPQLIPLQEELQIRESLVRPLVQLMS